VVGGSRSKSKHCAVEQDDSGAMADMADSSTGSRPVHSTTGDGMYSNVVLAGWRKAYLVSSSSPKMMPRSLAVPLSLWHMSGPFGHAARNMLSALTRTCAGLGIPLRHVSSSVSSKPMARFDSATSDLGIAGQVKAHEVPGSFLLRQMLCCSEIRAS